MDMGKPGAYFEDARDHCRAMVAKTESEMQKLQAKKEIYEEMLWKLDSAIDKEKRKAAGEIEY